MAGDFYPWIKALHVFSFVAWMAGLFYLPRLFVYHADAEAGGEASRLFLTMEGRLLRIIMRPAAVLTILSGVALVAVGDLIALPRWLEIKLVAVLGMALFHGFLERSAAQFARGRVPHSSRAFRLSNEIPTLLLAVIIIMAVVQPFQ